MDIDFLKQVIEDQRKEIEKRFEEENLLKREGTDYAKRFLKHPNILVILGVRRSGKSIFSLLIAKELGERFSYINFDDERLLGLETGDLNKVLQAFYELYGEISTIILDEVQNVKGWELFVSRLRGTKKIIVTGSNSKLLSGELATHLTGRYIDFTLYPFSFREVLDFRPNVHLTADRAKTRNQLSQYVAGSGFPEFKKFGSGIVTRIYDDIISKDCIRRRDIREEETFRQMARYMISNFSNEFTYSKLSNIFGIKDIHTTKNYIGYMKEAYTMIILERFSNKLKQHAIAPKKVYAVDHGLCNFMSFRTSKNAGRVLENVVCIELMRRASYSHGTEVYYWKSGSQKEVDFVVRRGSATEQLIQVCHDPGDGDTMERETSALLEAGKDLGCRSLAVVTDDYKAQKKTGGMTISFIPVWEWLLEDPGQNKRGKAE